MPTAGGEPILVKRYAGTRFYNTAAGCYVSVAQLQAWRAAGVAFAVIDAGTGRDVTPALFA